MLKLNTSFFGVNNDHIEPYKQRLIYLGAGKNNKEYYSVEVKNLNEDKWYGGLFGTEEFLGGISSKDIQWAKKNSKVK